MAADRPARGTDPANRTVKESNGQRTGRPTYRTANVQDGQNTEPMIAKIRGYLIAISICLALSPLIAAGAGLSGVARAGAQATRNAA